jgi:cyclic beta-1,2-glucan synthetase
VDRRLNELPRSALGPARAVEWLLDNAYLVADSLHQVHEHLPRRFYGELPKLRDASSPVRARVYAIARTAVDEADDVLDLQRLRRLVEGYQSIHRLTTGELWALPAMLRLCLLEDLSLLAPAAAGLPLPERVSPASVEIAVAACIQSLRQLDIADWRVFFESVSAVEAALRADPTGVYREMDFDSRDRYRRVIEELARWSDLPEAEVARAAVALAGESPTDDERRRHVGFALLDRAGRGLLERRLACPIPLGRRLARGLRGHGLAVYLGSIAVLSGAIVLALVTAGAGPWPWNAVLALLPASAIAVALVDWLVTHLLPPATLPKLDSRHGLPPDCPTAMVVPALLGDEAEIDSLLEQLEINVQGNADSQLNYVLLTDFKDSDSATTPTDDRLLGYATAGVRRLNRRYAHSPRPAVFHLLHRPRRWNPAEGRWMGWERKRGKLAEFNRLALGEPDTELRAVVGELGRLAGTKFVIALDADTVLPPGAAARLVGTLAHPLNRPRFDAGGRVSAGYTVLQPRIDAAPSASEETLFGRAFRGDTTLDLYSLAVSDVYQDLFGEGTFVGKGIYDVAGFTRSLRGVVPENALLSHDLFEGAHGRAALVSDIVLLEDYPGNALAYHRRQHRWTRGDWQLLPWLLPRVPRAGGARGPNRLSLLNRWKLIDNLRRSLVAPALVLLLILSWFRGDADPAVWTAFALGALAMPILLGVMSLAGQAARGRISRATAGAFGQRLWQDTLQWLLRTSMLLYEATSQGDAVLRTLYRLYLSRRRLLEWTSAAHTRSRLQSPGAGTFWRRMIASPVVAGLLLTAVLAAGPPALALALPVLVLWMVSPGLAAWASRPRREPERLATPDRQALRRVARRTWYFFETAIGPHQHWLVPDHIQDEPGAGPARRTSPTNLAMALVSVVAAWDFGYLDRPRVAATLRNILESMRRLDRFRGHLFNWYDTATRAVLAPRYVSTVDSGNLAAALLTVRQACEDAMQTPLLGAFQTAGLIDTVQAFREAVQALGPEAPAPFAELLARLDRVVERISNTGSTPAVRHRLLTELASEWLPCIERDMAAGFERGAARLDLRDMNQTMAWLGELRRHVEWQAELVASVAGWGALSADPPAAYLQPRLPQPLEQAWGVLRQALDLSPSLADLPDYCEACLAQLARLDQLLDEREVPSALRRYALEWNGRLSAALRGAAASALALRKEFDAVAGLAEDLFSEMDFRFLFNRGRQLFHIGFDVGASRLDPGYYDLLASEARLASLIAIGKGDVPLRHWLHLRRPLGRVRGHKIALSWGGTMFEFLMPALFTATPARTMLGRTCRAVIARQRAFGRRYSVPWGISESGFARRDRNGAFQYRAFGVPGTGLRRELGDRLVIAPYASALALPFAPGPALGNLRALEAAGGFGRLGFLEAVDFGPPGSRRRGVPVHSYMAHHQGMILAAIDNVLHEGVMTRRVHRDPRIGSVAPLLYERMPRHAPVQATWVRRALRAPGVAREPLRIEPWEVPPAHPIPQRHLLSNGRLSLIVSALGGSGSRWSGTSLTRWRTDPSPDYWGPHLYLQDLETGKLHPLRPRIGEGGSTVRFAPHQVEWLMEQGGLHLQTRLMVAPRDDVELRVLRVRNDGARDRLIALTCYAEVALAPPAEDRRHPAFAKLFVESTWIEALDALLFWQRPRRAGQAVVHLGVGVVSSQATAASLEWETDRARFLGRRGSVSAPAALEYGALTGTTGATLDPAYAIRCRVTVPAGGSVLVAFVTAAGARADVLRWLNAYRSISRIEAAFREAAADAEVRIRDTGLASVELQTAQELFSAVVHPYHALRVRPDPAQEGLPCQSALWPHAISGDYPLLAVSVDEPGDLPLVREVLRAHRLWRSQGALIDLVLIDAQPTSYELPVRDAIQAAITESWGGHPAEASGVFVVGATQLSPEERAAITGAARVFLAPAGGSLATQLERLRHGPAPLPEFVPLPSSPLTEEPSPPLSRPERLEFDNGIGGFLDDGREYAIWLGGPGQRPPRPWVNVVANKQFGFLVSESGPGVTWCGNSAENRLTPWRNDPLAPPPGEAIYLRDEETGIVWSPTPEPAGSEAPYLVRHGAGYTIFEHHAFGLEQELRLYAHPSAPVKLIHLRLANRWRRPRRITTTYFVEWLLGAVRDVTAPQVMVDRDPASEALVARCPFNETSGDRVAFLAASRPTHGFTTDRREFLGEGGWARPDGLQRIGLTSTVPPDSDPAAALQVHLDIPSGGEEEVYFVLGEGSDGSEARRLASDLRRPEAARAAWTAATAAWRERLDRVRVRTPDRGMDLLLNQWLPYQTLACRFWGRTGLYQSSGAFGFRDQLQDALALLPLEPRLTRAHLLAAARHQFGEGDVLHWWHPVSERGVRSRCSDDLVWLPFAVAHYVSTTGDLAILNEVEPFLSGAELEAGQAERFDRYPVSEEAGSLFEHCRRALDRAWALGPRGLPLIGSGDWNDGYDEVGREGRGESVWLAWFEYATLSAFARIAALAGQTETSGQLQERAAALRQAVEEQAWDGHWYRRAYFDDGTPLGSAEATACQIDSTAQTWAVLSGGGGEARCRQAMEAVWERLVRRDRRLVLLLAPPFTADTPRPGYISAYPPGIRENGAQYTHAAVWVAWALAELGDADRAVELFGLLNPIFHAATPEAVARYGAEPYVLAGDVLASAAHLGRAGWTWYTGSAAWLYRLGLERILGVQRQGRQLVIDPRIPADWPGFEVFYSVEGTTYHIQVENPSRQPGAVETITVDGREVEGPAIPLCDDGATHLVRVRLGTGGGPRLPARAEPLAGGR